MILKCQYCVLLPKLQSQDQRLETTGAEAKKNIYMLIESEWNVIQPDGSMDVPKIQRAHYYNTVPFASIVNLILAFDNDITCINIYDY